jgi:hypothetical protein
VAAGAVVVVGCVVELAVGLLDEVVARSHPPPPPMTAMTNTIVIINAGNANRVGKANDSRAGR